MKRAGSASALWTGRWVVVGTTLAFASAAFVAASLLPDRHVARVELRSSPARIAQAWQASQSLDGADHPAARVPPMTGLWALVEGRGAQPARSGVELAAPGSLIVWASDANGAGASRQAAALADRLAASLPAPADAALVAASVAPTPTPTNASDALSSQLAEARAMRDARAAALERLRAATGDAEAGDPGEAVRKGEADLARLRADIEARRQALEDLRRDGPAPDLFADLDGAAALRRLTEERAQLRTQVATLSQTLLDGHPRMVIARLRLEDLDGEVQLAQNGLVALAQAELDRVRGEAETAADRLAQASARKASADEAEARLRGAEQALAVSQEVVSRLEAALETQTAAAVPVVPAPAPPVVADPPARIERSELPVEVRRLNPWPSAAAGAGMGFLASTLALLAIGARFERRRPERRPGGLASGAGALVEPAALQERVATETLIGTPIEGAEIASVDDVIDAIVSSGVTRTMLVSVGEAGPRPLSVDIVRRLALRGRSPVLVDLSSDQRAARAMGAGPEDPGLRDLVDGRSTFASIARHDFATQADIVPYGAQAADRRLDTAQERRNVLDFIERSYDALLLDCGTMTGAEVLDFMDPDAAVLVAVGEGTAGENASAIHALRAAGLDDLIVVREARAG